MLTEALFSVRSRRYIVVAPMLVVRSNSVVVTTRETGVGTYMKNKGELTDKMYLLLS